LCHGIPLHVVAAVGFLPTTSSALKFVTRQVTT
jgi:hypothetical protein